MKSIRGAVSVNTFYTPEDEIERDVICDVYLTADDFELESVMYGSREIIDDLTKEEYNALEERCLAVVDSMQDDRGNEP